MDKRDEIDLDALFDAARQADPVPSADLMARVLAQSHQVQAGFAVQASPEPRVWGWITQAKDLIGGWAGASALTAVMAMGLIFGFSAPETIMNFVPGTETTTTGMEAEFLDLFDETPLDIG